MKILVIHNQYQQRGGEDTVFEAEVRLLSSAGISVSTYVVTNDSIEGLAAYLRTALETPYSHRAYNVVTARIVEECPDLVHVHNFFPLLTPSIFDACRNARVPTVLTLHNFRVTCANALLLRDGQPCNLCIGGSPYWSVVYRCYRNSAFGSLAVANMIALHRWRRTWQRSVNRFIALSAFARNRFIDAGLPADRIRVKPHFVFDPFPNSDILGDRNGALFVGRLSHEKGIHILLDAWRSAKIPLTIIGDGPDVEAVRAAQSSTLTYLGPLPSKAIFQAMRKSRFLLLPSIWYEGAVPRVVVEAFASGLPIIASRIGSLEELIDDNYNGYHFHPGDPNDLLRVISEAFATSERTDFLSRHARETYERYLTPEHNLRQLSDIYREAIDDAKSETERGKSPALEM